MNKEYTETLKFSDFVKQTSKITENKDVDIMHLKEKQLQSLKENIKIVEETRDFLIAMHKIAWKEGKQYWFDGAAIKEMDRKSLKEQIRQRYATKITSNISQIDFVLVRPNNMYIEIIIKFCESEEYFINKLIWYSDMTTFQLKEILSSGSVLNISDI